ncbi:aminotransferase class I/II-fold pyridoxal phosphate-dependent enzyme [Clostridium sp. MSJ-8]|uniref:aminotransferase class I/II-fold pyridoxal phosphate-dependent enzyme n=1 Tax=Clostridium sp. MSJ-8 TaxID=2841510 RepID=UPI001C0F0B29|nr:aminotransferase class I/II-fold pyridoxal phosphate-dependent enzyme [Clostridium sp. MSJ-8]MBU5487471.1 aminotransferase class I/II-fold pyridoxal phosphate-dependent enzyme [Clostridium sp. MSJ-8]
MKELSQSNAPILEALERYKKMRVLPFDVPGHKRGKGNKELTDFLGEQCLTVDVNSMKPLDNLCHPVSVIKDAQKLAAEAFGAKDAFFMINGTTSAVQAMVLSVCKRGEKIIMPRNVHRSAINALIISGAVPVYVNPGTNKKIGIPLGMSVEDVKKAILENRDAKAILVNNPTYYGICSNLKEITDLAHSYGMKVLVDEAHGTHFYFSDKLPMSAMEAGADMAAVSMHKTGGSLTQSSILLINNDINKGYVHQIINLTQTTSASYLLMSSLDITRRNLALNGEKIVDDIINLAEYARKEINELEGYYAYSKELIDNKYVCDFDITKLSICTLGLGLAGIEVYSILRDEYEIQIEFGDLGNVLAIISVGDKKLAIERLVSALYDIERLYAKPGREMFDHEYINPQVIMAPQEAFYADKKSIPIEDSENKICSEFVMCYPPGIPILAPGEKITREILDYIKYAKEKGCSLTGTEDEKIEYINVVEV